VRRRRATSGAFEDWVEQLGGLRQLFHQLLHVGGALDLAQVV
jgi:hypothetical protein